MRHFAAGMADRSYCRRRYVLALCAGETACSLEAWRRAWCLPRFSTTWLREKESPTSVHPDGGRPAHSYSVGSRL
jgi:hypothetical protein